MSEAAGDRSEGILEDIAHNYVETQITETMGLDNSFSETMGLVNSFSQESPMVSVKEREGKENTEGDAGKEGEEGEDMDAALADLQQRADATLTE